MKTTRLLLTLTMVLMANAVAFGQGAPVKITLGSQFYNSTPVPADDPIKKEFEKRTNTVLDCRWTPAANYKDVQNLTLASGDIPDVMLILNPNDINVRKAFAAKAAYDVTDAYKSYPSLASWPAASWNNVKAADGRIYCIPRVRPTDGQPVIVYRADLFKAAGVALPKTTEELFAAIGKVKAKFPDYTGFLTGSNNGLSPAIGYLTDSMAKVNGSFVWTDGKVDAAEFQPGYKVGLVWAKKFYDAGFLNKDFVTIKNHQDGPIQEGKWIVSTCGSLQDVNALDEALAKVDPKAEVVPGILNDYAQKQGGYFGVYIINAKVSPEKFKAIMKMLDYANSDEGARLLASGIEGIDYDMVNGKMVIRKGREDAIQLAGGSLTGIGQPFTKYLRASINIPSVPKEKLARNMALVDQMEKISIANPMDAGIVTATGDKLMSQYYKRTMDMRTKFVLGGETVATWDAYVAGLKNDETFQKILQELTESYKSKAGLK